MSFTEDELQSFNTILEQRLFAMQQEMLHSLDQKLARQMQSIEALLNQQVQQFVDASTDEAGTAVLPNGNRQLEAIEIQTELPWEDLADVIGQSLDARLAALYDETRRLIDNLEQRLAGRLHGLQDELARSQPRSTSQDGDDAALHELLHGIDHLERVIESLQVVMTANHALLSDRLYSHQQQPIERAHPAARLQAHIAAERGSPAMLSQVKEQGADEPAPAPTNHE